MWHLTVILLLAAELLLLGWIVAGRILRKKLHESPIFLCAVFSLNVALYLVVYLYDVFTGNGSGNWAFELMECMGAAIKMFLGDAKTGLVEDFALQFPVYTWAYLLGALLAVFATVSAAAEAFGSRVRNHFRLAKKMKQPVCDIVVGSDETALQYAQSAGAVVLADSAATKEQILSLIESGHTVLSGGLTVGLLQSRIFKENTEYHLICTEKTDVLAHLETFISANRKDKKLRLYIEVEQSKAETVRREIIDRQGVSNCVTTFSAEELLARKLVEENPVTVRMPKTMICPDASVAPDARIQVVFLGFGSLSREIYRQSLLNNQLVRWENGQYRVHPVEYAIFDLSANAEAWNINGLKDQLEAMAGSFDTFPLPELPYQTQMVSTDPTARATLQTVCQLAARANSFTHVFVDTGDVYSSIETGARLRSMLDGLTQFHLFVRSDRPFTEDDDLTTYYGDRAYIFNRDVIVNDSLSRMARQLNEIYEGDQEAAARKWKNMDYFTRQSNIFAAANLRLKLNLLGLDYVSDGKSQGIGLLEQRYPYQDDCAYESYFTQSRRNALLAQEHARWNAYHLLNEFLPMELDKITVRSNDGAHVSFATKNMAAKKHACLTTFRGLDQLSNHLARQAKALTGRDHSPQQYDYYKYDEMLVRTSKKLMEELKCSVIER